jgi:hypothetical protein
VAAQSRSSIRETDDDDSEHEDDAFIKAIRPTKETLLVYIFPLSDQMQFLGSLAACFLLLVSCPSSTAFLAHMIPSTDSLQHHHRGASQGLNVATTRIAPFNMTHSSPRLLEFPEKSLHNDYYSGVAIHVKEFDSDLAKNPTMYSRVLESSLQLWKMEQRRGIWIHIPKSHGHLIAVRHHVVSGDNVCTTDSLYFLSQHDSRLWKLDLTFIIVEMVN